MINTLSTAVVVGVLSASGAGFLMTLSDDAEQASGAYVSATEVRVADYNALMPGIASMSQSARAATPLQNSPNTASAR